MNENKVDFRLDCVLPEAFVCVGGINYFCMNKKSRKM